MCLKVIFKKYFYSQNQSSSECLFKLIEYDSILTKACCNIFPLLQLLLDFLLLNSGHFKMNVVLLHYNYTGRLKDTQFSPINPGTVDNKTIVFLIICSFIVLENLTVLVVIWRNPRFHNQMYFFIGNMALCDLLGGVGYIVYLLCSGDKTFGLSQTQWFIREGSKFVTLGASVYSLLAIAVERHLTMINIRSHEGSKNYRAFLLIGTSWLIAIAMGALPILGWNCIGNLHDCSTILPLYSKKYLAFGTTVFLVLLLVVSVLYARIYILVKSSSRKVNQDSNSEHVMSLLRTIIIVVGVLIVCWTPIFMLFLVDAVCDQRCTVLYYSKWFIAPALLNSAINPVIYTLSSREMRQTFLALVCIDKVKICVDIKVKTSNEVQPAKVVPGAQRKPEEIMEQPRQPKPEPAEGSGDKDGSHWGLKDIVDA